MYYNIGSAWQQSSCSGCEGTWSCQTYYENTGLCPGPAVSSIALLNMSSIIFVIAMFFGFYIAKLT